jgi:hypothetical protein
LDIDNESFSAKNIGNELENLGRCRGWSLEPELLELLLLNGCMNICGIIGCAIPPLGTVPIGTPDGAIFIGMPVPDGATAMGVICISGS